MNKLVIFAMAAATLCSCQINGSILHQQKEKPPVRVRVLTVSSSKPLYRNSYVGEAVPVREVTLYAPYSGTLKCLHVGKGSMVNRNDTLAVICSQQVESAYRIAQADLEQARDAMDRIEKVYGSGSVTEVQMKDIGTKLEKARATMASAQKAVSDCSIKAPYRGIVSEIYPSGGEDLNVGARVMKITDVSDLKISISVHENEIGNIKCGMKALIDIPALGIWNAIARVSEKSVLSSSLAHSYLCSLKMDRQQSGLIPGMAVKVRFESEAPESRIVIPASAVQIDSQGNYIWLSDSCTVKKRRIIPGGYSGKGVIIAKGLTGGEKVIVEGYQKVSSGMKIAEVE